jgi:hypothetical protein
MAETIVIKHSTLAGATLTPTQLLQGELAANLADKKLYTKDGTGAVIEFKNSSIESSSVVATTSGSTFEFTNVPSNAKRITVNFQSVSLNQSGDIRITLGSAASYNGTYSSRSSVGTSTSSSPNYIIVKAPPDNSSINGILTLQKMNDTTWVSNHVVSLSADVPAIGGGRITGFTGPLTRVRVSTDQSFDAGNISLTYEI